MQNKIILLGVLILIFFNVNIVFAYTDTSSHWAEPSINRLALSGIVSGYQDGTFKPNNNLTRAELVTIINRMLGNKVQNTRYVPDINSKDWFYVEIRKGIESGFIEGGKDGSVRPRDLITREEAIAMLQRALVPTNSESIVTKYSDFDTISPWAKEAFSTFITKKYISGYTDNTIKPKLNITRAEVCAIINRMIDIYGAYGEFTGDIHGKLLINGDKVKLTNLTVYGTLIIAEGATNIQIENVLVVGDLILRTDIDLPAKNFKVTGKTVMQKKEPAKDDSKYSNSQYGISFSIPEGSKVIFIEQDSQKINYNQKNLMTIRINQSDDLYFVSFNSGLFKEKNRYDVAYEEMKLGYIGHYKYAIYGSEKNNSYFVYLKRDNTEYAIYFYNIDNINIIESLVDSIELYEAENIQIHNINVYRNPSLYLKFNYVDYVAVDDSYNTGTVNEEDAFYKLFIQVTNIIDMSNYTIDQLKTILVGLEDTTAEIVDSRITKVYTYDAIEYTVKNDGKISKSLYIIISNKLYHFIFTSTEERMVSAGVEIYEDIINSIEF